MKKKIMAGDERTSQKTGFVCIIAVMVIYTYLVIELFYKVIIIKQMGDSGWAFGLLALLTLILCVGNRKDVNSQLPHTLTRKFLPVGSDRGDRIARIKHYVAESAVFVVLMTITFYIADSSGNVFVISKIAAYFSMNLLWQTIMTFLILLLCNISSVNIRLKSTLPVCMTMKNENQRNH